MAITHINSGTLLKRNPDMVAAHIDGDVVVMSVEHGQYFGITGVGSRVWELLEDPISIEEITEVISQEYDTDQVTCHNDMKDFVQDLVRMDMIKSVE